MQPGDAVAFGARGQRAAVMFNRQREQRSLASSSR